MNGWEVISILIICTTILSAIAILGYTTAYIMTDKNLLEHLREISKD